MLHLSLFYIESFFDSTGNNFGPKDSCAGHVQSADFNCINYVRFITTDTNAPSVVAEEFEGVSCVVVNAQTLVECTSPPGVGQNFQYKVMIGHQESLANSALHHPSDPTLTPRYDRPVIYLLQRSEAASVFGVNDMNDADTRGYTVNAEKTNL